MSLFSDTMTEKIPPGMNGPKIAEHSLQIITSGPERLEAVVALIDGARRSLSLITYTFADDTAGRMVISALERAALRGVVVTLIIDDFGSAKTPDGRFIPLRNAGARVYRFGGGWTRRYLVRNHQKLIIADGRIAMIGGFNIADAYFAPDNDAGGWRDLALLIEGPAVAECERWCDALGQWMAAPRQSWRQLGRLIRSFRSTGSPVTLLIGGPTPRLSPWTRALRRDLTHGRNAAIAMAYFSPNAGLLRQLARVARRDGALLVLPEISDNPATVGASRLLYGYLLKRGIRIHEFGNSLLHTKLIVIDNVTYIGSANFDMRSLYVNVEMMLRIDDAVFAARCRGIIGELAQQSTLVTDALHQTRASLINRLRWAASWFMVGILDYGVTRRLNFGLPRRD